MLQSLLHLRLAMFSRELLAAPVNHPFAATLVVLLVHVAVDFPLKFFNGRGPQ